jgi:hypothetical protein
MAKVFICDESRIYQHKLQEMILAIVIIGQHTQLLLFCYDALEFLNLRLMFWETMGFFLCTGFGELAASYGGTHKERLTGFGQGNAAAGPGFTAMSLLIVKVHLHNGFGAQIYSSYYRQLLILTAVMYVCNTGI